MARSGAQHNSPFGLTEQQQGHKETQQAEGAKQLKQLPNCKPEGEANKKKEAGFVQRKERENKKRQTLLPMLNIRTQQSMNVV
jgi:hypothetical protein